MVEDVEVMGLSAQAAMDAAADTLRAHLAPLLVGSFFYLLFTSGVETAGRVIALEGAAPTHGVAVGISLVSQVVGGLLMLGLIKMCQDALAGREPRVADLVMSYRLLWKWVAAMLLMGLLAIALMIPAAVAVWGISRLGSLGVGLALVTGVGVFAGLVYVFLGLSLATYEIVYDPEAGALEALHRSWRMTRGQRWTLLGLGFVSFFAFVLGALACGVGIIASYAYTFLLFAAAHRSLRRGIGLEDTVAPAAF